jgi:hypothetical protein
VRRVTFFDGPRRIGVATRRRLGLHEIVWHTSGAAAGEHRLRAVSSDSKGIRARAEQVVTICGRSRK